MSYPYPASINPLGPYQRAALKRERDVLLSQQHRLTQLEGARLDEIIELIGGADPEPETQKQTPRRKTA